LMIWTQTVERGLLATRSLSRAVMEDLTEHRGTLPA
jgi:hypothetical protein